MKQDDGIATYTVGKFSTLYCDLAALTTIIKTEHDLNGLYT